MSEQDEDFAAMFEASLKAKRFERGQTLEGTIVAIGPEVAFVNVGGKGEAAIDVGELKDDEGALEVAVGDRIQATVVSTEGGLTLHSRGGCGRYAMNLRNIDEVPAPGHARSLAALQANGYHRDGPAGRGVCAAATMQRAGRIRRSKTRTTRIRLRA